MKKIAFVIPYFGKFRNDFYFWVKSVEFNPTVDFLFFTDQEIKNAPQNLRIYQSSLEEIEKLAQNKLWNGCRISYPTKLCDYKTAYGQLFQEYLGDYDFWGHCDVDLVFGDIRHYITDDILSKYDRLGLEGPFSLYRNTPKVNAHYWCLGEQHIKQIFSEQRIYGLDEWGLSQNGTSNYWLEHWRDRLWMDMVFDNIEPFYYSLLSTKVRRIDKGERNVMFSFEEGKLYRYGTNHGELVKHESLFVHLQRRKIEVKTVPDTYFSVVPPGTFVLYIRNVSSRYLRRNIRDGKIWVYYIRLRNKINKLFGLKQYRDNVLTNPL